MLVVKDFSVTYQNGVQAIQRVNLSLEEGKLYGIIGPSGAGKSSFIKGMLGVVKSHGEVTFRAQPLKKYSKNIAYIQQKDDLDRHFPITVLQCVLMGTYPQLGIFKRPSSAEKKSAYKALEDVGLKGLENRQIGELSGGQFQRVLIARSLVQNATLFFLDEPFVGIDVHNEAIVIKILKDLVAQGKTVFVVHHGLHKVAEYFDEVILINGEVIAYGNTKETLNRENFNKTFKLFNYDMEDFQLPLKGE